MNILRPEDVIREMERSVKGDQRKFDFRHRLANGEVRDVEVYSSPIYIGGKPFLDPIIHDVTDKRRFEKALIESEKNTQRS